MLDASIVLMVMLTYAGILYGAGWWGDRAARRVIGPRTRPLLYGLSLGALCSSWTYFAAVGDARAGSWIYVANSLGPVLAITLGFPIWRRIARLAKQENVGSLADFLAARYGKSRRLGVLVTIVATLGAFPYISLQIIGLSRVWTFSVGGQWWGWLQALVLMAVLAGFAILFGVRRPSLTQQSRGLVSMVALESCVKIAALICVAGLSVTLFARAPHGFERMLAAVPSAGSILDWPFLTMTLLCFSSALTLPRQFHLGFVTLEQVEDVKTARWLVPVYFTAWPLAVLTIALALRAGFESGHTAPDMLLLTLPRSYGGAWLQVFALLGGISAGGAMVIVELTALSSMVSNELVIPWLAAHRRGGLAQEHSGRTILRIRRLTTVALAGLAWVWCVALGNVGGPIHLGMTALTASAQLLPALIGGIYWRGAHARGAQAGILGGMLVWLLAIVGPSLFPGAMDGPDAQGLFPLARHFHLAILGSLAVNVALYVLVSLRSTPKLIDRIQAASFVGQDSAHAPRPDLPRPGATFGHIRRLLAQFLGEEEALRALRSLSFGMPSTGFADDSPVSAPLVQGAERLLAGVIGAPSARNVVSIALAGGPGTMGDITHVLDEAAHAVHFSRELLQTTLENLEQGVSVSDGDMRLIAWNAAYLRLMGLPAEQVHVGKPLAELLQVVTDQHDSQSTTAFMRRRIAAIEQRKPFQAEVQLADGRTVRISGVPLGAQDYLATFTDITDLKQAETVLARSNEDLERRVQERTVELAQAKQVAEQASGAQRRFVAAASHDLVQPLHAARLFIGNALAEVERDAGTEQMLRRADQAVEGAHRLLRALLHLSQLEIGALEPALEAVDAQALLLSLSEEFNGQAQARGLELVALPTHVWVRSDRDLLRAMLQNLLVNAIRYTPKGRVVLACRQAGSDVRFEVRDTGVGISPEALPAAFGEFSRLSEGRLLSEGAGLGLSIVARIAQVLDHQVTVRSRPGAGSVFSIRVPRSRPRPRPRRIEAQMANLQGLRVLCVEDEPDVLIGTKALIERWGGAVTALAGAEEVPQGPWDAVIADYHLGGEDGLSLLRRLAPCAGLRLLVTAMPEDGMSEDLAKEGITLLRKPVSPLDLQDLLMAAARARSTNV